MATVKATCRACGDVETDETAVTLVAYGGQRPEFCLFRCPGCGEAGRRELPYAVVAALRAVGAREVRLRPEIPTQRAPLTLDDLIDLGIDMEAL